MKTPARDNTRLVISATLACLAAGPVAASDWKFSAGVSGKETYTDNVALSPKGSAKSDWITEITPTFTAEKNGARLKVNANYSYQNLIYANDATRNTNYHQLDARANAELFRNEIFLDATASIRQAATNPQGAVGADNSSATGNVTNVQSYTLSPYWQHRFGTTANLLARVTLSDVSYSGNTFQGSTNTGTVVALTSGPDFGRYSWGLNYSDQQLDYADRPDVSFNTVSATVGYLITPRIKLLATTGYEKNDFPHLGPAPEGTFWRSGISWAVSERTKLDIGMEDHYYGQSGYLAFKTRGNYSEWTVDYNESVTTANSQQSFERDAVNPQLAIYTLPIAISYPFNLMDINGTIYPANTLIPAGTQFPYIEWVKFKDPTQILSDQVLLNQRFTTGFNWTKGKHRFNLSAYRSNQKAVGSTQISSTQRNGVFDSSSNVKQLGFSAGWTFAITPEINSTVSGGATKNTYSGTNRDDVTTNLQFSLDRKFSPKLTGTVSLRRQARDSNDNSSDYTENALSASLGYKF